MPRLLPSAAAALLIASFADSPQASAQPQVPGGGAASRPTVSPYLNLLGGYGNPGLNYLGIVRPQQQLLQQFGQIQQQQQQLGAQNQALNQALLNTEESLLPPTGNVSVFNSTGGYFNRIPGITGGGGVYGSTGGFNRPLGGGFSGAGGSGNQPSFSRTQSSRGGTPRR